jgi:RNA 2',3'-cyclic 3'-phosphodiesterase
MTIRSFIALEISEPVKLKLLDVQGELKSMVREIGGKVGWSKPDGWHVTLHFLGDIDPQLVDQIGENLGEVASGIPKISMHATGLGVFGGTRPRVIWVGIQADDCLGSLHGDLGLALTSLGIRIESRLFKPHLTLGRIKTWPKRVCGAPLIDRFTDYDFGGWHVERIALFRSELHPSGARYSVLKEAVFRG